MKKCICDDFRRGGCPVHDVSECCEAEKYLDSGGFSHCQKCNKLFTGKDWDKEYCECKRCKHCGKIIKD